MQMFRNLNIATRLMGGFLLIASLVAIVSFFSFKEMKKLYDPLTEDIPKSLKEIERTSRLDSLAQQIRYYDQVLTEAARNYAMTGDLKWKYRYKDMEPQLGNVIKESIEKGDAEDKKSFSDVQKAKQAFVDLEYKAIASVDGGSREEAMRVLESAEYWRMKQEYKSGLEQYVERRGKKLGESLEVTTNTVDHVVKETLGLLQGSTRFIIQISMFAIFLAVILGFLISRSISNPISALQKGAEVIGKGNLNYQIPIESGDEVGTLAKAFNEMTVKLKESYGGLEQKVREKTRELTLKVEEIEQAKAKDEALLESIGEGMIATDREGKIMMMNKQAEEMIGESLSEVSGKVLNDVITLQDDKGKIIDKNKDPLQSVLATGRSTATSVYYASKAKPRFPVALTISPVVSEGKIIGAIEIFRDMTKEKEIDQMKNEFVSTVSHELRTPLAIIKEFVSLVLDGVSGEVNEKQRKFLTTAKNNIDRLARIINDLLDISKIEAGKIVLNRSFVDVKAVIEDVLETYRGHFEGKKVSLHSSFDKKLPKVFVDKDKLIQIITNLIGNAAKFTPENGLVVVTTIHKGQEMEFSVADTGTGIARENLSKVFGKFEQFGRAAGGGAKGTGLGLAISKGLVEMHGGKMWIDSEFGKGTKFTFTLPYHTIDSVFELEVKQRLKESQKKLTPFSVIGLHPVSSESKNGEVMPDQDVNRISDIMKGALRKSTEMVLRYDEGKGLAAIVEADTQEVAQIKDRINTEIEKIKVKAVFQINTFDHQSMTPEKFLSDILGGIVKVKA